MEPHVFDAANGNGVPARMSNFGTTYNSSSYCVSEVQSTDGDLLMGGSQSFGQISCKPNTGNVGNYYDWVAAVAGDNILTSSTDANDSICPFGWQLPSSLSVGKTYVDLVKSYTLDPANAAILRTSVTSFLMPGYIGINDGKKAGQESTGRYWARTTHNPGTTNAQWLQLSSNVGITVEGFGSGSAGGSKGGGVSVRCVAR